MRERRSIPLRIGGSLSPRQRGFAGCSDDGGDEPAIDRADAQPTELIADCLHDLGWGVTVHPDNSMSTGGIPEDQRSRFDADHDPRAPTAQSAPPAGRSARSAPTPARSAPHETNPLAPALQEQPHQTDHRRPGPPVTQPAPTITLRSPAEFTFRGVCSRRRHHHALHLLQRDRRRTTRPVFTDQAVQALPQGTGVATCPLSCD